MAGYTYNPPGVLYSVFPVDGQWYGATVVTILGFNLGNGTDISSVTLNQVQVMSIVSQTADSVTVVSGDGVINVGTGDVVVMSRSVGTVLLSMAFTYNPPAIIATVYPATGRSVGGDFVTIVGSSILGNGSDITTASLVGVPATVVYQDQYTVILHASDGSLAIGDGNVTLISEHYGLSTLINGYRYNVPIVISSVYPPTGRGYGGNIVTLYGAFLGNGSDIYNVTLGGVDAAIVSQTYSTVTVQAGAAISIGLGNVTIQSVSFGDGVLMMAYRYNIIPVIQNIVPVSGPWRGGNIVTLTSSGGTFLGNVSDITAVSLCGLPATIQSQTATTITVMANVSEAFVGTGDAMVDSTSFGISVLSNAYVYNVRPVVNLTEPNTGPHYGANVVTLSGNNLGSGSDITMVKLKGLQAVILSQTGTTVTVVPANGTENVGLGDVETFSVSYGESLAVNAYRYNNIPIIDYVYPDNGPHVGNTTVTIYGAFLGNGSDIYYLSLNNVSATITGQSASTVTVVTGNGTNAVGIGSVIIASVSFGVSEKQFAFRYNVPPVIQTVFPKSGPHLGGNLVTIRGVTQIGNGTDISLVTINYLPATIVQQDPYMIIVTASNASECCIGTGNVVTYSYHYGIAQAVGVYVYNIAPVINSTVPATGPHYGANIVTISGNDLGNGTDITMVKLKGLPALILSQTGTTVTVVPANGTENVGLGDVQTFSTSFSEALVGGFYRYNNIPVIDYVYPDNGPHVGNMTVTIYGTDLGNGNDIYYVSLNNVSATILAQTATTITVATGNGTNAVGIGSVIIASVSFGVSEKQFAYRYNIPPVIQTVFPKSGPHIGNNTVTITGITQLGNGTDVSLVTINTRPALIIDQTPYTVTVIAANASSCCIGTGNVIVFSYHYGISQAVGVYVYNVAPFVNATVPNNGRSYGANTVTISGNDLGNGTDITLVTLKGLPALILEQTGTTVTVIALNGTDNIGTGDVVVYSTSFGVGMQAQGYTYNPPPLIYRVYPATGRYYGGNNITVYGQHLGNGNDITFASLCGLNGTITGQTATTVTVTAANGIQQIGLCNLVMESVSYGLSQLVQGYRYNVIPSLSAITPDRGPQYDPINVTITGSNLGNGSDITSVFFNQMRGIIVDQDTSYVVIITTNGTCCVGLTNVTLDSTSFGVSRVHHGYRINPAGDIITVFPNKVPLSGLQVSISGRNLNDGVDLYLVQFNGVPASIISQSDTLVVVIAGPTTNATVCDLVMKSTSFGTTTTAAVFTYHADFVVNVVIPFTTERDAANPGQFEISLNAPPNRPLTVPLPVSFQAKMNPAQITFTPGNWNVPQLINVYAEPDLIDDNDVDCLLFVGPSFSADYAFVGLIYNVSMLCVNINRANVTFTLGQYVNVNYVEELQGQTLMVEGIQRCFDLVLNTEPLFDVTFLMVSSDPRLVHTPGFVIRFTNRNWNVTQPACMTASDPSFARQLQTEVIARAIPDSADPKYNATATPSLIKSIPLLLLDADQPDDVFILYPSRTRITTEWGVNDFFWAVLVKPQTVVTVAGFSSFLRAGSTQPTRSSLTMADYLLPFIVNCTGGNDDFHTEAQQWISYINTTAAGISYSSGVLVTNLDKDSSGIVTFPPNITVNETGQETTFNVRPLSRPFWPVTVTITSLNNLEVTIISSPILTFDDSNYKFGINVTAKGLRNDSVCCNVTTNVRLRATSVDPDYNNLVVWEYVRNLDIVWPTIVFVYPTVFPQLGKACTIYGTNFVDGLQMWVNDIPTPNTTVFVSNNEFQAVAPAMNDSLVNTTGRYYNVTLRNPDGGWLVYDGLFYTEDCPYEGQFGSGLNCRPCPIGGICPGGQRVWAMPGFFTSDELAGIVTRCNPAAACLGGRYSDCAPSYTGRACGSCIQDYYKLSDQSCAACADERTQAILMALQFAFVLVFVIGCVLANDPMLNNMQFLLLQFKVLWVISTGTSTGLPEAIAVFFAILSLFAGDLNFIHPGCRGISSWSQLFGVNIAIMLGICVPFLVMIHIQYRIRVMRYTWGVPQKYRQQIVDFELNRQYSRMTRGLGALLQFGYEVLVVNSFDGLFCRTGDQLTRVLDVDPTLDCFSTVHWPIFITSMVILFCVGVLFPIYTFIQAKIYRRGDKYRMNIVTMTLAHNTTEEFVPSQYAYGLISLLCFDLVLAGNSVLLTDSPYLQFWMETTLVSALLIYMIVVRPFLEWYKNAGSIMVLFVSLLSSVASVLGEWGPAFHPTIAGLAWLLISIVFVYVAGVIVIFVYLQVVARLCPPDISHGGLARRHPTRGHILRQREQPEQHDVDPEVVQYLEGAWDEGLDAPRLNPDDFEVFRSIEHTLDDTSPLFYLIIPYLDVCQQQRVRQVCKRFKEIIDSADYLDMYGCGATSNAQLLVTGTKPYLRELSLALCDRDNVFVAGGESLNDEELGAVINTCPDLEVLNLRGHDMLTDDGLVHLARLPNLFAVDLSGCDQLTNDGLQVLAACGELVSITALWCPKLTPEGMLQLARSCARNTDFTYAIAGTMPPRQIKERMAAVELPGIELFMDKLPVENPYDAVPLGPAEYYYESDSEDEYPREPIQMPVVTLHDRLAAFDQQEMEAKRKARALEELRARTEQFEPDAGGMIQ
eukprot:TRINITY_DN2236_c0_g1_i2.p1 TRINITY_DN2236_c0_g1~~TRINITY_DN2236_c0_g1_i2.p1  ORF type:complete len:2997 (-),score=691.31 TRINITY_DN2236_c0_g1_i2:204-8054(-)